VTRLSRSSATRSYRQLSGCILPPLFEPRRWGALRYPRFRRVPFVRDVASDPGSATEPRVAVPHMLPSTCLPRPLRFYEYRGSIPHPTRLLCTLRRGRRLPRRNTHYWAGATPYPGRICTGWNAPAFLAHQPSRYLHDCSDCFRLERSAGWALHPLESAAFPRHTPEADYPNRICRPLRVKNGSHDRSASARINPTQRTPSESPHRSVPSADVKRERPSP
jgi:hypothetical protein